MIKLVQHIYEKYYKKYSDEKVNNIFSVYNHIISMDIKKIVDELCIKYLYEYGLKVIIQDFHNSFDTFHEKIDNYYYRQYLELENGFDKRNNEFHEKYISILSLFCDYLGEMIHNLWKYRDDISCMFNIDQFKIKDIKITSGDAHNHGKKVSILKIDKATIVYKPRNMSSDSFYYKLLKIFNQKTNSKIIIPNIFVKNNFSIQEYFDNGVECENLDDVRNYYFELGIHSCFLYTLSATDIHYENIIAHGKHPVIIDLETLFQEPINIKSREKKDLLIEDTVLYTLLFDFSVNNYENVKMQMGGIGNYDKKTYIADKVVADETDKIHIEKEEQHMTTYNLPCYLGRRQASHSFLREFINGFEVAYKFLETNRALIKKEVKDVKEFNVRIVVRPTYVYAKFLEALNEPNGYTYKKETEIFEILKEADQYSSYHNNIFECECNALRERDVPYFYMCIDQREITVLSNEKSKRYSYTPREYIMKRLNLLSIDDLKYQTNIIQMVWACNYDNSNILGERNPLKIYSDSTNLKNVIHKYLKELQEISKDKKNWQSLSIRYDTNGIATVSPLNYDLYDGLAGIALLFCAAYKNGFVNEEAIIDRVETCMTDLYKNYPWKGNWSVFHGRFSYIRYWWLKQSIIDTTNKKFKANLFEICEELMNELVTNKYLPCDYIGGLAGIISFLVDIYNKQDEVRYKIKNVIVESVKYILDPVVKGKKDFVPCDFRRNKILAGFAHGITGIVYAIAKAVKSINDLQKPEILQILNKLLKEENSLFDSEKMFWIDNRGEERKEALTTWCSGAMGILLGREEINKLNIGIVADKIKETREIVLNNAYILDYGNSLCHGCIGNLMLLKHLSSYDKKLLGIIEKMVKHLEKDYLKYGMQTGYKYNNPSLSFFLGIPGEIYGLIYLYYDENLPMILL